MLFRSMRGPQKFTSGFLRFKGYQDVCQENGIEERFIDCKYSFESGKKAALKMIETFPDTEGIFAANDMVALSAYKILRNHGIRVPENIQIVGFDDIGFSSLFSPEITTIHQPIQKMGQRAVDIIYQYSNGQPFEKESIFEVQLIKRETTCI